MYMVAKIVIKGLLPVALFIVGCILLPMGVILWLPAYGFARIKM